MRVRSQILERVFGGFKRCFFQNDTFFGKPTSELNYVYVWLSMGVYKQGLHQFDFQNARFDVKFSLYQEIVRVFYELF